MTNHHKKHLPICISELLPSLRAKGNLLPSRAGQKTGESE